MWYSIGIERDGTVHIHPDNPDESTRKRHAALGGGDLADVMREDLSVDEPLTGDVYLSMQRAFEVLMQCCASHDVPVEF